MVTDVYHQYQVVASSSTEEEARKDTPTPRSEAFRGITTVIFTSLLPPDQVPFPFD